MGKTPKKCINCTYLRNFNLFVVLKCSQRGIHVYVVERSEKTGAITEIDMDLSHDCDFYDGDKIKK